MKRYQILLAPACLSNYVTFRKHLRQFMKNQNLRYFEANSHRNIVNERQATLAAIQFGNKIRLIEIE